MSNQLNFQLDRQKDAILSISMAPPTSVSGWEGEFYLTNRKGGVSKIFSKTFASGYVSNQSGITLTDGVIGRFNITVDSVNTSGLDYGCYHASFVRTNSGFFTPLSEGYITIK